MRNILIKTAVAGFLCLGLASCADDLNISSIDPQSSPSYDDRGLLAKQYATLGLTGQAGPAGKGDMSQDEVKAVSTVSSSIFRNFVQMKLSGLAD